MPQLGRIPFEELRATPLLLGLPALGARDVSDPLRARFMAEQGTPPPMPVC